MFIGRRRGVKQGVSVSADTTIARRAAWVELRLPREDQGFVFATGEPFRSHDPATADTVATLASSTPADVDRAVAAAERAFRASRWASDGELRARVLHGFAEALRADVDSLAELLTREQGKTIHEAHVEVYGAAKMVDYYAGLARAVYGRSMVLAPNVHGVVLREPCGIVAVITPWNWPLVLLVRSLAPRARRGQRLRRQAGEPHACRDRRDPGAARCAAGPAGGRARVRARPGRRRRRGPRGPRRSRHGRVHRRDRDRHPRDEARGRRAAQGRARAGRQGAECRLCRRRPRQGTRGCGERDLHHLRSDLHGG